MQKIKTKELEWVKSLEAHHPATEEAFRLFGTYLYIYDNVHNSNHLTNAQKLYIDRNNDSIVKICNTLYTNDRSLCRYRNEYLNIIDICTGLIKKPKEEQNMKRCNFFTF